MVDVQLFELKFANWRLLASSQFTTPHEFESGMRYKISPQFDRPADTGRPNGVWPRRCPSIDR